MKILIGEPAIIVTRIPVELLLEKIAAGESFEQILEAYPGLTREAIRAAFAFAAEALRTECISTAMQRGSAGAILQALK
jgi:uncharacterized protein (DUF433 family)